MARFKLFLIGNATPIDLDLPVSGVTELNELASRTRFLEGHMTAPDGEGVCAGVLVPTCRIQLVVEAE